MKVDSVIDSSLDGLRRRVSALERSEGTLTNSLKCKTLECDSLRTEITELRMQVTEQTRQLNSDTWQGFRQKPEPQTLLMGSSLIRDIDPSKLKHTDVVCVRGGHIKDFSREIDNMDKTYDRTVMVLGGNDCTDAEPEKVIDDYRNLMKKVKKKTKSLTVSSICPRLLPTDIKSKIDTVNAGLQCLCIDENVSFMNNDPSFYLADGTVNDAYLLKDGVHLTYNAVNKLAKNLNLTMVNPDQGISHKKQLRKPHKVNTKVTQDAREQTDDDTSSYSASFWEKSRNKAADSTRTRRNIISRPSSHRTQHEQKSYGRSTHETGRTPTTTRSQHSYDNHTHGSNGDEYSNHQTPCYNCGEANHNTIKCRFSYRLTCNECGDMGHKSKHHD